MNSDKTEFVFDTNVYYPDGVQPVDKPDLLRKPCGTNPRIDRSGGFVPFQNNDLRQLLDLMRKHFHELNGYLYLLSEPKPTKSVDEDRLRKALKESKAFRIQPDGTTDDFLSQLLLNYSALRSLGVTSIRLKGAEKNLFGKRTI